MKKRRSRSTNGPIPSSSSGQKDFVKEKFQKAREKLEKCIEIMPEHANAWLLLAQIESKENHLDQALEDIQKAKMNFESIAKFQTLTQERLFTELREQKVALQAQANALESALSQMGGSQSTEAAKLAVGVGTDKRHFGKYRYADPTTDRLDDRHPRRIFSRARQYLVQTPAVQRCAGSVSRGHQARSSQW